MRKRIYRLSEAKFDNEKPDIILSDNDIRSLFVRKRKAEGVFTIRSGNNVPIRGIVYSSNPYVICQKPEFEGTEIRIKYHIADLDHKDGESLKGEFTVVANTAELHIPYTFTFIDEPLRGAFGTIDTLEDFTALAKERWHDAMALFYSDAFAAFMEKQPEKQRLLYSGYKNAVRSSSNLEEFLVSAGQKERTSFTMEEGTSRYYKMRENEKNSIEIQKTTWGYIEIDVECDSDFVTVEKEHITNDYFLGSVLIFDYYVHRDRLHAGINKATIRFKSQDTIKEYHIEASLQAEDDTSYLRHFTSKKKKVELTSLYKDFRFGRVQTSEWCTGTLRILQELKEAEADEAGETEFGGPEVNVWYLMMQAQALIVNRQRQDALFIISDLKKDIDDKKSAEWAYLLYLCTLIEQEESYVNRLTDEIEKIRLEHQGDVRIFWFLLFLREEYLDDNGRKLNDIRKWVDKGECSPFIYLEAYYILKLSPYLFNRFEPFFIKIMKWICHEKAITADMSIQVAHALEAEDEFKKDVYEIAKTAYEAYPSEELLMQILIYILKAEKYGSEYLKWYEKAVNKEVRLTGLYEAYLMSLPDDFAGELPEKVTMYFKYQSNLSYQKKAFIYAGVIGHKRQSPLVYEQYLRGLETFTMEQMRLNHMDDNLAICYQNIMDVGLINPDISDAMSRLIFTKKIGCRNKNIRRIIVLESFRNDPWICPVTDSVAYVPVFTENSVIFLEDDRGVLYAGENEYYVENLIRYEGFYEALKAQSKNPIYYIVHDYDKKMEKDYLSRDDLIYAETFLNSEEISDRYKAVHYPDIARFLHVNGREDILEKHLLLKKPYASLSFDMMVYMMEICIQNGFYEEALRLMYKYNGLSVDVRLLLKMCTVLLSEGNEVREGDDFFISLCAMLLKKDVFSSELTEYMAKYYSGPTDEMMKLCTLTHDFNVREEKLYERTIMQMLYTDNADLKSGDIFRLYLQHNPNRMVMEAYITFYSDIYMRTGQEVPDIIFMELLKYYLRETRLNEPCRLALMKHLCLKRELTESQEEALDSLVKEFTIRNIYFPFYREMEEDIQIKYHLYDKTFLSFNGERGRRVLLRYALDNGDTYVDEMPEMYEGIFVKTFILFFGETVEYEVFYEDQPDEVLLRDKVMYQNSEGKGSDRYTLLNRMQSAVVYGETEELIRELKEYQGLDEVTGNLFKVI